MLCHCACAGHCEGTRCHIRAVCVCAARCVVRAMLKKSLLSNLKYVISLSRAHLICPYISDGATCVQPAWKTISSESCFPCSRKQTNRSTKCLSGLVGSVETIREFGGRVLTAATFVAPKRVFIFVGATVVWPTKVFSFLYIGKLPAYHLFCSCFARLLSYALSANRNEKPTVISLVEKKMKWGSLNVGA